MQGNRLKAGRLQFSYFPAPMFPKVGLTVMRGLVIPYCAATVAPVADGLRIAENFPDGYRFGTEAIVFQIRIFGPAGVRIGFPTDNQRIPPHGSV